MWHEMHAQYTCAKSSLCTSTRHSTLLTINQADTLERQAVPAKFCSTHATRQFVRTPHCFHSYTLFHRHARYYSGTTHGTRRTLINHCKDAHSNVHSNQY